MVTLSRLDISRCYKFVASEEENNKWQGIQLLESTGKYKDIIYKYGKVKFRKKGTAKGELPLTFHYDLIYSNDMSGKELQEDLKFKNLLGDILMDIMEKQLEDFIISNWENTEFGMKYDLIYEDGVLVSQQYRTSIGKIDILFLMQ